MMVRTTLILACAMLAGPALAQTAPQYEPLPTFAQIQPKPDSAKKSPWQGLYVGTEVFGFSGGKGVKGGFGGGGYAGYDHEFANNVIVGVSTSAGYAPGVFKNSTIKGFEYGTANVKVGYDLGRVQPYVMTGIVLAHPNNRATYLNTSDSINDLINGKDIKVAQTVGAGVDFDVTDKLRVGVGVAVGRSNFGVLPPPGF
jgi:opacity protein-like surface antigen